MNGSVRVFKQHEKRNKGPMMSYVYARWIHVVCGMFELLNGLYNTELQRSSSNLICIKLRISVVFYILISPPSFCSGGSGSGIFLLSVI